MTFSMSLIKDTVVKKHRGLTANLATNRHFEEPAFLLLLVYHRKLQFAVKNSSEHAIILNFFVIIVFIRNLIK